MFQYIYYLWPVLGIFASVYLYRTYKHTVSIRKRFTDLPSLPRHPIWGNLVNAVGELNNGKHPDYGFENIWNSLGQPAAFVVDLAPIQPCFLLIAEPQYIEPCVSPSPEYKYSLPKSDTYRSIRPLIGRESLVTTHGEEWKTIRKRFNPAFQPKHLYSLTPFIVEKVEIFVEKLKEVAASGKVVPMMHLTSALTIDVIAEIAMQKDFGAQLTPPGQGEKRTLGILNSLQRLADLAFKMEEAFNPVYRLNFIRPLKEKLYEYNLDWKIEAAVAETLRNAASPLAEAKVSDKGDKERGTRSVIRLATAGLPVSRALIRNTAHQVRSFLFAGHDTTSSLLQWQFYELSRCPTALSKLCAEHDDVFGPDPFLAGKALAATDGSADRILGTKLPYTTAVVKETLRLRPTGGTARHVRELYEGGKYVALDFDPDDLAPTTTNINDHNNNNNKNNNGANPSTKSAKPPITVPLNGLRVYPAHWLIQRNPKVWGPDAHTFRPDRWLDEDYMAGIPVGAYRPFERGPRNCIGQELAMMEAKIVLAMTARPFRFAKATPGEAYSIHAITQKPNDEMRMTVRLAEGVAG